MVSYTRYAIPFRLIRIAALWFGINPMFELPGMKQRAARVVLLPSIPRLIAVGFFLFCFTRDNLNWLIPSSLFILFQMQLSMFQMLGSMMDYLWAFDCEMPSSSCRCINCSSTWPNFRLWLTCQSSFFTPTKRAINETHNNCPQKIVTVLSLPITKWLVSVSLFVSFTVHTTKGCSGLIAIFLVDLPSKSFNRN